MRDDNEVSVFLGAHWDGDWGRKAVFGTALVEDLSHRADVHGVVFEDFDQRVFESKRTHGIEQLQQARGVAADILAALGQATQKALAAWC
jgi:hypothetical protein